MRIPISQEHLNKVLNGYFLQTLALQSSDLCLFIVVFSIGVKRKDKSV